ncbi:MAG TPA: hypothetical protein VLX61_02235, partial [Anaerolineales bacterium]|nr:hypothetical protein [Anaerolineales bacterium]
MGNKHVLATDPRGLPVEFWDERWDWIKEKHADLEPAGVTEEHFKNAIEKPAEDCIFDSKKYPDCDLYYMRFNKYLQIRVVVRYIDNIGEIV